MLKLLDAAADRAPVLANRVLALTRKVFNWSQERGYIEASPCADAIGGDGVAVALISAGQAPPASRS